MRGCIRNNLSTLFNHAICKLNKTTSDHRLPLQRGRRIVLVQTICANRMDYSCKIRHYIESDFHIYFTLGSHYREDTLRNLQYSRFDANISARVVPQFLCKLWCPNIRSLRYTANMVPTLRGEWPHCVLCGYHFADQ